MKYDWTIVEDDILTNGIQIETSQYTDFLPCAWCINIQVQTNTKQPDLKENDKILNFCKWVFALVNY